MDVTVDFLIYLGWGLFYCSPILLFLVLVVFATGFLVGRLEGWCWTDTLYWTIITATTVGYGDFSPVKHRSRFHTIAVVLVGMMFTGVIVAITINATTVTLKRHMNVEITRGRVTERLNQK